LCTLIPKAESAAVLVHQFHDFIVHRFRFGFTGAYCARCTILQMVAHQFARHASQRLLHRGYLRHDIGAVAILLNHPLQSAHLSLDPAKSLYVAILYRRIDCNRLARIIAVVRSTAACRDCKRIASRKTHVTAAGTLCVHRRLKIVVVCLKYTGQIARKRRSLRLLLTTLTELNAIAALARIGLRSRPKAGYRMPAAIGIPTTL